MKERECNYKIIAFVNGKRKEINCDPEKGCLKELVWSGISLKAAASQMLNISNGSVIEAMVDGDCKKPITSVSTSGMV